MVIEHNSCPFSLFPPHPASASAVPTGGTATPPSPRGRCREAVRVPVSLVGRGPAWAKPLGAASWEERGRSQLCGAGSPAGPLGRLTGFLNTLSLEPRQHPPRCAHVPPEPHGCPAGLLLLTPPSSTCKDPPTHPSLHSTVKATRVTVISYFNGLQPPSGLPTSAPAIFQVFSIQNPDVPWKCAQWLEHQPVPRRVMGSIPRSWV